MRFITEDDLRLAYKEHAFSVYEAKAGERLTPGGRQFLNDHGIRMDDSAQAGPWMGRDKQVQDGHIGDKSPCFLSDGFRRTLPVSAAFRPVSFRPAANFWISMC